MRMKTLKKLLPLLLLMALALNLFAGIGAFANNAYTVRVYPGVNATLTGGSPYSELQPYGGSFSFDASIVNLTAEGAKKYYIMGLREGGKDNSDYLYPMNSDTKKVDVPIEIKKDMDFVVAYGIEGTQVSLTVSCVNGNTGETIKTETYYGNYGERVLIKAPYVDNMSPERQYLPAKLGTTTTGTVRYYPIPEPTVTVIQTGGTTGGNTNTGTNTGNNTGNANTNTGNNTIGNNTNAGNGNTVLPGNLPTMPQAAIPEEEILDLDVPLAAPDASPSASPQPTPCPSEKHARLVPKWILIVGALLLFGLVALVYWYLLFYRKKKQRDEEYENEYDDYGDT